MTGFTTKYEKTQEILKCGKNPVHFINTYVYIQHPVKGRIKFDTYPFQDDVVKDLQKHRFNIVLKSRQLGLSTIAAAYAVWYAIFHKDKNIIVIATKLDTAQNFIKKVKIALKSLPPWLILPTWEENKTAVTFSNGSQIVAIPTSDDAGRSEAISLLIIDEAAFVKNFDTIWTGLSPTISTGGAAFILSTPNGVGGIYYKLWADAQAGLNNFNPIKLPWYVHPEHDQAWFDKETRNLSQRKIAQEFLCDFLASGKTFLSVDDLNWLKANIQPPIEKEGFDNNVWIWKYPESGKRYVISADIARGDAADFSAFHIIDADDGMVVAEYMGKAPPDVMAKQMDEYGRRYNDGLAVPENNTFGYMTAMILKDLGYPSLYYDRHTGDPFTFVPPADSRMIPGFSTQTKSRQNILTKLEELIRNKMMSIHSSRFAQQMQAFICDETGRAKAMKDSHDDLIMSLAIGMYIVGGAVQHDNVRAQQTIAMLSAISKTSRNASILPGMGGHVELHPNMTTITMNVHDKPQILSSDNSRNVRVRQQMNPHLAWLLK